MRASNRLTPHARRRRRRRRRRRCRARAPLRTPGPIPFRHRLSVNQPGGRGKGPATAPLTPSPQSGTSIDQQQANHQKSVWLNSLPTRCERFTAPHGPNQHQSSAADGNHARSFLADQASARRGRCDCPPPSPPLPGPAA